MLTRQLNFEEGKITLLNEPILMMIPGSAFIRVQEELLKSDGHRLYGAGKLSGNELYKLVWHYAREPKKILKFSNELFNVSGFGKLEVIQMDFDNHRGIFHMKNSINSKISSDDPVCHYIRGVLVGLLQLTLDDRDIEGIESNCVAKGDPICEFILQRKGEMDKNSEMVKKQLNI